MQIEIIFQMKWMEKSRKKKRRIKSNINLFYAVESEVLLSARKQQIHFTFSNEKRKIFDLINFFALLHDFEK